MAKDTFYFSHDYNARSDIKIKKLVSVHGFAGYGIFWAIVEDLYNNQNSLPTDFKIIAYNLRVKVKLIESIVKDFELFVIKNETFGSFSIQKRIEERDAKSVKARESAYKRWEKDANAMPTQSEGNAIKDSIEKERKGKKRIVNKGGEQSSLFLDIKNCFLEWYQVEKNSAYYFTGKDGKAINELIKQIQFAGAQKNEGKPPGWELNGFKWMLKNLPDWVNKNASLTIISSKFNEIKDGHKSTAKQQNGNHRLSAEYLADLARRTGYEGDVSKAIQGNDSKLGG